MKAICQRCGEREHHWTVRDASFNVREVVYWKLQLCERCAVHVEMCLRAALAPPQAADAVGQRVESRPDDHARKEDEHL
jgi:hypothetical protein